ncbi:hypothetical protein [Ensifer aridi]|uniref:hypothetical protein n=1 Tax=Ensifer aridi TaxID=1708715 RepID=UPI000A11D1C3|nr:hypothetical protein [Ensifer aridi]
MTIYRSGKKCLRDWLVGSDDAARAIHVNSYTFQTLVREGFIKPTARTGFFRMGNLLDGYAEAVRMGRIPAPHERAACRAVFECQVPDAV